MVESKRLKIYSLGVDKQPPKIYINFADAKFVILKILSLDWCLEKEN